MFALTVNLHLQKCRVFISPPPRESMFAQGLANCTSSTGIFKSCPLLCTSSSVNGTYSGPVCLTDYSAALNCQDMSLNRFCGCRLSSVSLFPLPPPQAILSSGGSSSSGSSSKDSNSHKDDGLFKAPPPPPKVIKSETIPTRPYQDIVTALKCRKEHKEVSCNPTQQRWSRGGGRFGLWVTFTFCV